jgi:hypothetical protein
VLKPDQRDATCFTLRAVITPADTIVSASPTLKHTTSTNPRLICFSWMQSNSTVMAAGHGMSALKASPYIVGMSPGMGIVLVAEVHVAMLVLFENQFVHFPAAGADKRDANCKRVGLSDLLGALQDLAVADEPKHLTRAIRANGFDGQRMGFRQGPTLTAHLPARRNTIFNNLEG